MTCGQTFVTALNWKRAVILSAALQEALRAARWLTSSELQRRRAVVHVHQLVRNARLSRLLQYAVFAAFMPRVSHFADTSVN